MNFHGPAHKLKTSDIRTVAGYLGCSIAALRAVMIVEAASSGFGSDGRPLILFEPHVFYRELGAGAARNRAVKEGLAYAKWGAKPYPRSQAERYRQLEKAMQIDAAAALRSASWGLGQVMGFNHKAAGFDSVADFVTAMTLSEGAQLYAMARFIVSKGLQGPLRRMNWATFAKGYNGAGYKKNAYDTKLAKAYAARPAAEKSDTPAPATLEQLDALIGKDTKQPEPVPTPRPDPVEEPADAAAPADEKLSHSKRFLTWLTTGGIGTVSLAGIAEIDVWLQRALGAVLIGLAIYAIFAMPAVRKKLGFKS